MCVFPCTSRRVRVRVCIMMLFLSLFPLLSIASPSDLARSLARSLTHLARCRSGSPRSWPRPWPAGLSGDSSPAGTFRSALSKPAPWPLSLLLAVRRTSYETGERAAQINPTATRLHFERAAAAPPPATSGRAFQNKSALTELRVVKRMRERLKKSSKRC